MWVYVWVKLDNYYILLFKSLIGILPSLGYCCIATPIIPPIEYLG